MYDPGIEPELERICLRCLSRPMSERYLTAADLAADLKRVIDEQPPQPILPEAIVPKGLGPFDVEDARFFLALLPGPRRGDGMPESVRFWKDRVEAADGAEGLQRRRALRPLRRRQVVVRQGGPAAEPRPRPSPADLRRGDAQRTEARLLAELRREVPALPADVNLPDAVAILRDDAGASAGCEALPRARPVRAVAPGPPRRARTPSSCGRCDSATAGASRRSWWSATTSGWPRRDSCRRWTCRWCRGGTPRRSSCSTPGTRRKVLEAFGRALGQLPEAGESVTAEAEQFLEEVASGLTDADGRVIPMRLSLFTEVVRHRPWTPATLRELGGVDGIGVKFLDDCFAKPEYQHYGVAAKKVLDMLLPPPTSVIRGRPRCGDELRSAAGYAEQPGEFAELMRVLADELRLVTVAETDGSTPGPDPAVPAGETRYQLAHDFLVRPIRRWLEREQGSTRRGTSTAAPEAGHGVVAWSGPVRGGSPRSWSGPASCDTSLLREWSTDERRLMVAATRHYVDARRRGAGRAGGSGSGYRRPSATAIAPATCWRRPSRPSRESCGGSCPRSPRSEADFAPTSSGSSATPRPRIRQRANAVLLLHREQPTAERAASAASPAARGRPGRGRLDPRCARHRPGHGPQRSTLGHPPRRLGSGREPAPCRMRARGSCAGGERGLESRRRRPGRGPSARGRPPHAPAVARAARPGVRRSSTRLRNVCADAGYDPVTRSTAAEALAWTLSTGATRSGSRDALTTAQPEASLILLRQLELIERQPATAWTTSRRSPRIRANRATIRPSIARRWRSSRWPSWVSPMRCDRPCGIRSTRACARGRSRRSRP